MDIRDIHHQDSRARTPTHQDVSTLYQRLKLQAASRKPEPATCQREM